MSRISTANAILGIGEGSTWGTSVNATQRLRTISFTATPTKDIKITRSHDTGNRVKGACFGAETYDVNIVCALTAGNAWLMLLKSVMGTQSTPSEQNAGEGDYLSTFDIASTVSRFYTIAVKAESDVVFELPSVKFSGFSLSWATNDVATITFTGIADKLLTSGTENSIAELDALTHVQDDEEFCFNGSNFYVRYGDYSTGTALSSSNNQEAIEGTFDLQRPLTRRFGARGANTKYTLEPELSGISRVTGTLKLSSIDDSKADLVTDCISDTAKMMELFIDGSQIGAGLNNSLKFQAPYLKVQSVTGVGIDGPNTFQQPQATFEVIAGKTAPAGMSGVTDFRVTSVDENSSAW